MEGRALRILAVLLLVAVAVFWAVKPKRNKVAQVETEILPAGADARIEGVTFMQSGPKGEVSVVASNGVWSREVGTFTLQVVEMVFLAGTSGEGTRGTVKGERGTVSTDYKHIALEGKVQADTFDGYRIKTSDVRYDRETGQVTTKSAVSMEGPGLSVVGKGATVDIEDQTVRIGGRVRSHLVWSVLKENVPELEVPKP